MECCCGFGKPQKLERVSSRTDAVDGGDLVDGRTTRNFITCLCCWFTGCHDDGVYIWLKNLLIFYNFLFWALGCVLISLGLYSEVMRQRFSEDAYHVFLTPSIVLITVGTFSFVFATLGGLGALRDNLFLLKVFIGSVLFFIVLELSIGILALVFKEPTKEFVNKFILKGMTTYYDDQDLKDVVDYVQKEFECCGSTFYKDWEVNIYHNCSSPGPSACGVPYSCCLPDNDTIINLNSMCGYDTMSMKVHIAGEYIYLSGCIDALLDFFYLHINAVAGLLLGVFLPQITGIFLGVFYMSCINRIIDKQEIQEKELACRIHLRAMSEEDCVVSEGNKRLSYPGYVRNPSLLPAEPGEDVESNADIENTFLLTREDSPQLSSSNQMVTKSKRIPYVDEVLEEDVEAATGYTVHEYGKESMLTPLMKAGELLMLDSPPMPKKYQTSIA